MTTQQTPEPQITEVSKSIVFVVIIAYLHKRIPHQGLVAFMFVHYYDNQRLGQIRFSFLPS